MTKKRWDTTETFTTVCKLIDYIQREKMKSNSGNLLWTIGDINSFQDMLKEEGCSIESTPIEEATPIQSAEETGALVKRFGEAIVERNKYKKTL